MKRDAELYETTQCLCLASRRTARAITREFDVALRAHGLRATQFSLLAVLALKGPQGIGELARALGTDRTTLTRNLAVAEVHALVAIGRGDDARSRIASITEAGRRTLKRALAAWKKTQVKLTEALGIEAAEGLWRLSRAPSVHSSRENSK